MYVTLHVEKVHLDDLDMVLIRLVYSNRHK